MNGLFGPTIALMNRLKYRDKMLLVALIFTLPIAVLLYMTIMEANKGIAFVSKERQGLQYIQPVIKVIQKMQQHRGMSAAFLGGDSSFKDKIAQKQAEIAEDIKAIDAVEKKLGRLFKTTEKWSGIKNGWQDIQAKIFGLSMSESFARHTELIASTLDLTAHIADNSNLTLDPEMDSYYTMDTIISKLPPALEYSGQSRALGSGAAARKSLTQNEKEQLLVLYGSIKSGLAGVTKNMETVFGYNAALKPKLETVTATVVSDMGSFLQILNNRIINAAAIDIQPQEYFGIATKAIDAGYKMFYDGIPVLDGLLKSREQSLSNKRNLTLLITGIALLLVGYLFIGFYMSVRDSMSKMQGNMARIAGGDLTECHALDTRDELGDLSGSIEHTCESLTVMIGRILKATGEVTNAVDILRTRSDKTAEGARNQSGQAAQIAAAAEEMSQTITDIARSASAASETSEEAMEIAESGKQVTDITVETITSVNNSTKELAVMVEKLNGRAAEIGDIVTVIKDIADQTNLLALNAAIEAARAGEQGRGFAVVADEVRKLAERTIKATAEITGKIGAVQSESVQTSKSMGAASKEVTKAAGHIKNLSNTLNIIVETVQKVRDQITQIATAVDEQSAASEEVANNIEKTSSISKDMEKMAADVMDEVNGLVRVAEELKSSTSGFKIK
jgi:methyl-accepting chemotaxis protein